ncbi:MAG TPA: POTRA domain-containing protein [Vicinamibacterales bacterium]|nr:POTRA domain-containing protein [Vicinamibacterales bacterium]
MRRNSEFRIQNSGWLRFAFCLHSAFCILHLLAPSAATAQDLVGQPIVDVVVEQEGQRVTDPAILDLIETRVGQPLSMTSVRETFDHLFNLRRFDDIRPTAEPVAGGARLRYVLMPSHPVDRIEFSGNVAISEGDLRRVVTDRFGRSPNPARADEAAIVLQNAYRPRGYPAARVSARVVPTHNPHRSTLIFDVEAGRRARIAEVQFRRLDLDEAKATFTPPDIRMGEPYDADDVRETLDRWEQRMRAQGFYQARATVSPNMPDDAYLIVSLLRGPLVMVEFTGDPVPEGERDRLVPVRAEGSTDEDLLEDSKRAIEQYFRARGYRDATAEYTREETPGQLKITFRITRGPHYTVDAVRITGNSAIPMEELQKIVTIAPGSEFDSAALDVQLAALQSEYTTRGFPRAQIKPNAPVLPTDNPDSSERRVEVSLAIEEGPRTTVRAITFTGNMVFPESQLRGVINFATGAPYRATDVADGRDLIAIQYRNRGYANVAVGEETTLAENGTQADVAYTITEGQQIIVERIIVTGNDRTDEATILDELEIREGEPLGEAALNNSRTRLARLGLFRRIVFQFVDHPGEARRDVVIQLEEAPRTTLGLAPGVEATVRARRTGPGGTAEDHLDLAPRGSFEIGRRNLWGTTSSANLFMRVSLRATDILDPDDPLEEVESNLGFNEFRIVGTFRKPRVFSDRSELLLTGIVEQAVRTSFNFSRRIARAEVGSQLTPRFGITGRYSFERTRLFDEIFTSDEKPLIDRLFPEVRLSKLAGSFIHDTRDDLLDPATGTYLILDTDVAMRAIGSEVGFVRTYAQGFLYRQLPMKRRAVVAFGARVGAAHGFERIIGDQAVSALPASERFFAGGDTSVRGFSLDRLGNEETISPNGFPLGGNGVVILNGELRMRLFGALQGVGFVDAGNVFPLASDLSVTDLRPAAGFGVRVNTDFGPIRMDLGFNLDPQQFREDIPRERRMVFHISIGQAF